jgi:uncharacterized protein with NRDE domain
MCVLLVAYQSHPDYDLVVAANRDEFYTRPSAPAQYWEDHPTLLAGRDLQAGGTWLGVNAHGHFGAVTNLRGGQAPAEGYSRGYLVRDFLVAAHPTEKFLTALTPQAAHYAGCNLMLSDRDKLWWWSNEGSRELAPGVYGISNTLLDHAWPKVERLKAAFAPLRELRGVALADALLALLRDARASHKPAPLDYSRLEETIFVHTPAYGTRCTSIVLRERSTGRLHFIERRYDADAEVTGESRYCVNAVN